MAASSDLDQRAAVLLESLVRNHALIDVNNRIGCLAAVVFYGLNHIALEAPDDDAYDLVIGVASGHCVRRRGRPADQVAQSHYGRCGRSRGNARTGADEVAAVPPEATVRGAAVPDVLSPV